MSYNTQPIAVGSVNVGQCVAAAANANRDGTGALVTLYTAGATVGALIPRVTVRHQGAYGASTAMVCRLFRTRGGTTTLIDEVALPSTTSSATAIGAAATFPLGNYELNPGDILKVCQSVAESVAYEAGLGGDF